MAHYDAFFQSLADDELRRRIIQGLVADDAMPSALAEAKRRGLGDLEPAAPSSADPPPYLGDMVLLDGGLSPQEAQVLAGLLRSAGLHAFEADTGLVQTDSLLAIALGGCRIRVPESQLPEAKELLAAFRRGEFDLGDDFDPKASDAAGG